VQPCKSIRVDRGIGPCLAEAVAIAIDCLVVTLETVQRQAGFVDGYPAKSLRIPGRRAESYAGHSLGFSGQDPFMVVKRCQIVLRKVAPLMWNLLELVVKPEGVSWHANLSMTKNTVRGFPTSSKVLAKSSRLPNALGRRFRLGSFQ
jgi:hypothetical protein